MNKDDKEKNGFQAPNDVKWTLLLKLYNYKSRFTLKAPVVMWSGPCFVQEVRNLYTKLYNNRPLLKTPSDIEWISLWRGCKPMWNRIIIDLVSKALGDWIASHFALKIANLYRVLPLTYIFTYIFTLIFTFNILLYLY